MRNILTVDVEDYFHPSEVRCTETNQWLSMPSRVQENTKTILDIFDDRGTKGTFFVLGWVAQHHPSLVREIANRGHDIGCHSYAHRLVYNLSPNEFRSDTHRAIASIADACGIQPRAYRAPSYSITKQSLWAVEILVECGFTHDSSIYPIYHDRYGFPGFKREAAIMETPAGPILEAPVATVCLAGRRVAPVGGGAYLRLLPYRYTAAGIRKINEAGQAACIYFHPWEIDADQPRLARNLLSQIRTYAGLAGMKSKISRLLSDFLFAPLEEVYPAPAGVRQRAQQTVRAAHA